MRKVITLICILTARLSFAGYYYYQGERVPIVINPDSVVVYKANSSLSVDGLGSADEIAERIAEAIKY